jgi:hypothetical protein
MTLRQALILAAVVSLLLALGGFYWKGRHDGAAHEQPKTEAALARAAVAGLEAKGAAASAGRVDAAVRRREGAAATVAQLTPQALKAEDADAPLNPDRAARLRAADLQLCHADPGLAGCASAADAR